MTTLPVRARRFLRYNLVGLLGLAVKFSLLIALTEVARLHYVWATALAVEAAVLHGFTWHIRWTWRDRSVGLPARGILERLLRFHLANGAVAMIGNLLVMRLLVGGIGLHYVPANLCATAVAGAANFFLSEFFVFAPHGRGCRAGPARMKFQSQARTESLASCRRSV
jgi:putative flippase GtrA